MKSVQIFTGTNYDVSKIICAYCEKQKSYVGVITNEFDARGFDVITIYLCKKCHRQLDKVGISDFKDEKIIYDKIQNVKDRNI